MDKKEFFSLKQIILGLHDECQIHQQELQKLKEFCTMDEKKVKDFWFRVYQPENKRPTLLCEYDPNQNQFQRFITYLSEKSGYYIYGRHTAHLVTDNNTYYFLSGNSEYPVHIKYHYGMEEQFYQQASLILGSEFANNMRSGYIEKNTLNMDAALSIDSEGITLYIRKGDNQYSSSLVWYNSSKETILFKSYEENLDAQYMEDILAMGFPASELNSYHLKTINASKKAEMPIAIECMESASEIEFSMEEKNQFVLSKIRK